MPVFVYRVVCLVLLGSTIQLFMFAVIPLMMMVMMAIHHDDDGLCCAVRMAEA